MSSDGRLKCAWCGLPLNALELIEHRSLEHLERWGWHPSCYEADDMTNTTIPWLMRRENITLRGFDRVGLILHEATERPQQ